jgi:hypothetical protein
MYSGKLSWLICGFGLDFKTKSVQNRILCFWRGRILQRKSIRDERLFSSRDISDHRNILDVSSGCGSSRHGNFSRFPIFPVRNANFVQIENQFSCRHLDMFVQKLDCSFEEDRWFLQTLLFSGDTFCVENLIRGAENKPIDPSRSGWNMKLIYAVIFTVSCESWCASFSVLSNLVENFLFMVLMKGHMAPADACAPILHHFWGNRMSPTVHWSKLEYCVAILWYHEQEHCAGIRIRFFQKSHLVESIYKRDFLLVLDLHAISDHWVIMKKIQNRIRLINSSVRLCVILNKKT